ncbi:hypothetical protein L249_5985 [Ophiocordyceps polyrhachis-furcata BCC 54312]|uniref:Uncharacterized protein n=1 Tax=Ophiocordyceps polyrhachis-furcata BCC 54312 TaxID=1330021 RepID=A0A367LIW5_9HYPO|nr:hypothetical protein L249_5985 [Ophiocordyceps polyrhachis-furcata BCC 54312]
MKLKLMILPSSTLTYLYKIGDLEEDLYVPYPAVSAVLRGVWVRIRPYL